MRYGIAATDITPPFKTQMAGYSARDDYFDAVHDPLSFTAVVLEEGGRRAFLGAADLCSLPNDETLDEVRQQISQVVRCPVANVLLNASHTHGGPKLPAQAHPAGESAQAGPGERYRAFLYERILATARSAVSGLQDGSLWFGEGTTRVPLNRRADRDGQVVNAPNPGGGTDSRLQVLALRRADGSLGAVGMRVSCHPVATGAQHLITAEYPGAWRAAFNAAFGPGVTPFFLQGAGADARPRLVADGEQWRMLPHAELTVIGAELLRDVLVVLTGANLRPLTGLTLEGTLAPVYAPCDRLYTRREDFEALCAKEPADSPLLDYARQALRALAAGKAIPDQVRFRVQTLWLNRDLALIGLDAEPLYALGAKVEAAVAPAQAMLLGYVNGCVGYTPDRTEMARGGYETSSYQHSLWTGPLKPGLEDVFAAGVARRR